MRFRTLISGRESPTGNPISTHVLRSSTMFPTVGNGGHVLTEGSRWDWIFSGRKTRIHKGSQNVFFIPRRQHGSGTGRLTNSIVCGLIRKAI